MVGAAAILAADTILLVIMLIGLLRHAHGGSIGIRNLLYKQVTPDPFHYRSAQVLKTLSVHHLDNLGGDRRDTTGGLWSFSTLIFLVFTPVLPGFLHSRFKWYVFSL